MGIISKQARRIQKYLATKMKYFAFLLFAKLILVIRCESATDSKDAKNAPVQAETEVKVKKEAKADVKSRLQNLAKSAKRAKRYYTTDYYSYGTTPGYHEYYGSTTGYYPGTTGPHCGYSGCSCWRDMECLEERICENGSCGPGRTTRRPMTSSTWSTRRPMTSSTSSTRRPMTREEYSDQEEEEEKDEEYNRYRGYGAKRDKKVEKNQKDQKDQKNQMKIAKLQKEEKEKNAKKE